VASAAPTWVPVPAVKGAAYTGAQVPTANASFETYEGLLDPLTGKTVKCPAIGWKAVATVKMQSPWADNKGLICGLGASSHTMPAMTTTAAAAFIQQYQFSGDVDATYGDNGWSTQWPEYHLALTGGYPLDGDWAQSNDQYPSDSSRKTGRPTRWAASRYTLNTDAPKRGSGKLRIRVLSWAMPTGAPKGWTLGRSVYLYNLGSTDLIGSEVATSSYTGTLPPSPGMTIGAAGGTPPTFSAYNKGNWPYWLANGTAGGDAFAVIRSTHAGMYVTGTPEEIAAIAASETATPWTIPESLEQTITVPAEPPGGSDWLINLLPEPFKSWVGRLLAQLNGLTSSLEGLWWFLDPWSYFDQTRS